jgi:hypothetical protein
MNWRLEVTGVLLKKVMMSFGLMPATSAKLPGATVRTSTPWVADPAGKSAIPIPRDGPEVVLLSRPCPWQGNDVKRITKSVTMTAIRICDLRMIITSSNYLKKHCFIINIIEQTITRDK